MPLLTQPEAQPRGSHRSNWLGPPAGARCRAGPATWRPALCTAPSLLLGPSVDTHALGTLDPDERNSWNLVSGGLEMRLGSNTSRRSLLTLSTVWTVTGNSHWP